MKNLPVDADITPVEKSAEGITDQLAIVDQIAASDNVDEEFVKAALETHAKLAVQMQARCKGAGDLRETLLGEPWMKTPTRWELEASLVLLKGKIRLLEREIRRKADAQGGSS